MPISHQLPLYFESFYSNVCIIQQIFRADFSGPVVLRATINKSKVNVEFLQFSAARIASNHSKFVVFWSQMAITFSRDHQRVTLGHPVIDSPIGADLPLLEKSSPQNK